MMMGERTHNILVVEKDPVLSDLLEYWIGSDSHTVFFASNESGGYREASNAPFDVIIVDVDSFGGSGVRLIANLRGIQPEASIFAIVPSGKEGIVELVSREGADYSMEKPMKIDDIKEYLSRTVK